jgi:elongator complex protein 3
VPEESPVAPLPRFDPEPHREELVPLIRAIEERPALDPGSLDELLRLHPRGGSGFFSRAEIIAGFRHFRLREGFRRLRRRPVRSRSGVTPIAVLTRPHPCPGRCVFCPNDVRMPKSYLSDEPGAQRAAQHRFDPYLQTWSRLATLRAIGHPTDKVELIVLGGTWSFHPEPYQVWFVARCFEALNDFGAGLDRRGEAAPTAPDFGRLPRRLDGRAQAGSPYNRLVSRALREAFGGTALSEAERGDWATLEAAQRANESAASRCVGLSLETRPDHVDEAELSRLRRLGCTKVQLGIQSLSDRVLLANRRGHDVAATRRAVALLRRAGFKLHAHWMPNLLGATPAHDVRDFRRLFDDPGVRPDELKLYPCSLIESAELMRFYERGAWRPYTHEELLEVVTGALRETPRWCRLSRVVRDISSDDIVAGNKLTNFREIAERALRAQGEAPSDVRAREVRGEEVDPGRLSLRATAYATSVGRELFLELVTESDRIAAFLRLCLPAVPAPLAELGGSAIVREVHVYGPALALGARSRGEAQHRGLGQRLVAEAAQRAHRAGYRDLAVISAVGTRAWYRRLGFRDGPLYQHRPLTT